MKRIITLFALLALFTISAQAQIVGANANDDIVQKPKNTSVSKPKGHYLRCEAGFPTYVPWPTLIDLILI